MFSQRRSAQWNMSVVACAHVVNHSLCFFSVFSFFSRFFDGSKSQETHKTRAVDNNDMKKGAYKSGKRIKSVAVTWNLLCECTVERFVAHFFRSPSSFQPVFGYAHETRSCTHGRVNIERRRHCLFGNLDFVHEAYICFSLSNARLKGKYFYLKLQQQKWSAKKINENAAPKKRTDDEKRDEKLNILLVDVLEAD